MANYGPTSTKIEYDNAGGALVDISAHCLTINGLTIEQILEECRPFGEDWEKHLPIGVGKVAAVELGGLYDDVADTGPDALFANRIPELPSAATRTLKITWGGTKTSSVETHLVSYDRPLDRSALGKYKAKLQPTGTVTEA